MELENKVIIITGASRGLGKETALHLSRLGAKVVLVARSEGQLKDVQGEINAITGDAPLTVRCDISSTEDVSIMAAKVKEKYGKVDVLVNNAGFATYRKSENLSNQEMQKHFEVNFFGAYYCIKALLPLIKQNGSGYILNIGSLFSQVALAENSVYAATKFALAGFTEGLRLEMKPFGIGVGLFLPGPMDTSFQNIREESAVNAPKFMTLDPQKAAVVLENMIRRNKKTVILPVWMLMLLKIRYHLDNWI